MLTPDHRDDRTSSSIRGEIEVIWANGPTDPGITIRTSQSALNHEFSGLGELLSSTPYRACRRLGVGAMSVMVEAEHIDTGRRVAIKLLRARACEYEWVTTAFCTEAHASARIGSPHVVDILDIEEFEDGRLMVVTPLLEGTSLRAAIERGPMTLARLLPIARQICSGLQAAHEAGIVHLDVKPENVMLVEQDGRVDQVKLLDFGMGQVLREQEVVPPTGARWYRAPETAQGRGDARADVYAVGCLLHELTYGEPALDGAEAQLLGPSTLGRSPVPGLDPIVRRCLQIDPEDRFQTMAELEAALCELRRRLGLATPMA